MAVEVSTGNCRVSKPVLAAAKFSLLPLHKWDVKPDLGHTLCLR